MEQATHFVDLMRFFAGEILEDTVKAVAVGPEQKLVDMPAAPEGEHEVTLPQQLNILFGQTNQNCHLLLSLAQQLPYSCHELLWCYLCYLLLLCATTCKCDVYTSCQLNLCAVLSLDTCFAMAGLRAPDSVWRHARSFPISRLLLACS